MLQLKNVKKDYQTAGATVQALKGVSLRFRKNEFVSILGASGCGKTTLLNIIGGLDHYTSGDLVISGVSTKDYKDHDWDVYRNHRIGFVFQSYNLIPHQTVLGNVELALTIAGISKAERRQRAEDALIKVGLKDELHKRPNQLSGGQMQRVAIARALVNNPEILLADEPTGALDTVTSIQIMELIREIAGERLVIMVTHNPELAEQYSSRIVRLQDGLVVADSDPYEGDELAQAPVAEKTETEIAEQTDGKTEKRKKDKTKKKERSSMSFGTSLGLSARNLLTKKGRTAITSVAGSIGIISVCLVLALSNGFNSYILKTEEDMLSYYPVEIAETTMDVDAIMSGMSSGNEMPDLDKIGDKVYVNSFLTNIAQGMQVTNNLSKDYLDHISNMPEEYYTAIQYSYGEDLTGNLFTQVEISDDNGSSKEYVMSLDYLKQWYVNKLTMMGGENAQYAKLAPMVEYLGDVVSKMPGTADFSDERFSSYVRSQYDIVEGRFPESSDEAVLVIGSNNDVTDLTLAQLGFIGEEQFLALFQETDEEKREQYIDFADILDKEYTLYYNDAVYAENPAYTGATGDRAFVYSGVRGSLDVENGNGVKVKVTGILRLQEGRTYGCLSNGLNITEKLVAEYIQTNKTSKIVAWMNDLNNALPYTYEGQTVYFYRSPASNLDSYYSGVPIGETTIPNVTYDPKTPLCAVGGNDSVTGISIYTESFETKEGLLSYLDEWNDKSAESDQVKYTDRVGLMMSMVETILDAITYVLVAFTAISLVVSSVMIGIITYVSVVERTKEIGVLRSLGARKRDIKNLFNAETFIIGLTSGVFGVVVTYLLSFIVNAILKTLTGIAQLAALPFTSAFIMICVSVGLTLISGLIPAQAAAKKDPVIALRTE